MPEPSRTTSRFTAAARRTLRPPSRTELATVARILVCATIPWYLCVLWGTSGNPVPAAMPAVLVGVGLSVAVLRLLPHTPYALPLVLALGYAGSFPIRRDGVPNNQVVVSALLVFAIPVPGYPEARLLESAVGVAVVALLGPRLRSPARCAG